MIRALAITASIVLLASCHKPETLGYRVISTRPHDPDCYTQGLEFSGNRLFESGGLYGESTVREVDPATGTVLRKRPMAKYVFAEGITLRDETMWVLTWKEKTAYVLDRDTFKVIATHAYPGEGWGLTHDGKHLVMSDGSSTLKFLNPDTFAVEKTLEVRDQGRPVEKLNELEYADGHILANIYTSDRIARIDPANGRVTGWLDLAALRRQLPQPHRAEELNGIARDPATGHLLVTGKRWPRMFEIECSPR